MTNESWQIAVSTNSMDLLLQWLRFYQSYIDCYYEQQYRQELIMDRQSGSKIVFIILGGTICGAEQ